MYRAAGAVAQIIDVSCMHGGHEFTDIASVAYDYWTSAPSHMDAKEAIRHVHPVLERLTLGEHYFVTNPETGSGTSPRWDFTARLGNPEAYVTAAKKGGIAAPTGKQDVDWLYLTDIAGGLACEIYRTDTRAGQPPATCTPGSDPITVKYTSLYWFTGGNFGDSKH
ncbi:hypothetical protein VNI00_000820 [Paramarasmius palmivorus]|uniref:Uncharacterized protein n=1 Tax=Paramarasmius palmivorus TaxID=297713 RepID=A0AAW0E9X4_9AGAR